MTQPTRGFGVVVYRPFSASSSARRIMARSKAVKLMAAHLRVVSARLHFLDGFAEIVGVSKLRYTEAKRM